MGVLLRTSWPLLSVLVALGIGCGDSKPPAPTATTAAPTATAAATATATATATAEAPPKPVAPPLATGPALRAGSCPKLTGALEGWLKVLQSEGPFVPAEPGITLVDANQAAGALPAAPRLSISARLVTLDGAFVASSRLEKPCSISPPPQEGEEVLERSFDAKPIAEALAKKVEAARQAGGTGAPYVLLEIDRGAPWQAVVAAADAVASAGATFGTFLFAAPTTASAPPASPMHSDFHAKYGAGTEKAAALLSPPEDNPGALGDVYKECPAAAKVKHAPSEELAKELPKALAACNCKVDMGQVQALAWLVYHRYSGVARTGLTLNLAKSAEGAHEVALAATTPWSEASAAVREAAGKGKPVKLVVK